MSGYLLRRLAQVVPTALLAATLVFSLIHLIPGDPVEIMLGEGAQRADVAALRHDLGLDRPLLVQYGAFLGGLVRGDLGHSLKSGEPVLAILVERFPATLQLSLASMLVALLVSLPLGVLAALYRDRAVDHGARLVALLGVSVPSIWLGPMLILLFAISWDLLPVSGREGAGVVLPAITLGAGIAGLLVRMVRAALADELVRPYLLAARARGVAGIAVVGRHALKNALVPVVTVLGLQFGSLLTGAILTETIFAWPGVGRLLVESIRLRDYPLLQGAVLLIAFTYLFVNLGTDLVYAALDPRIRYGRRLMDHAAIAHAVRHPRGTLLDAAAKRAAYDDLLVGLGGVLPACAGDPVALMASAACLVYEAVPAASWAGFYRVVAPRLLRVGPYQGPLGCLEIPFDRGVCGAAARERRTQLVEDVEAFPGHIACDAAARSEIVVPVFDRGGELMAVLDLDSHQPAAFDDVDREGLEAVARLLAEQL